MSLVYGNDDRWYQNIFIGGQEADRNYGTADYDGAPTSIDDYISQVKALGHGDVQLFAKIPQLAYINNNVYLSGAKAFCDEQNRYTSDEDASIAIMEKEEGVYLQSALPHGALSLPGQTITTVLLGKTHMSDGLYETPDGQDMVIDYDLLGQLRADAPTPGPIENLKEGRQDLLIWKR